MLDGGASDAPSSATRATAAGRTLAQCLRLIVGLPDYGQYVAHMQATHPGEPPMDCEAFFRNRQAARYGGGAGPRCC